MCPERPTNDYLTNQPTNQRPIRAFRAFPIPADLTVDLKGVKMSGRPAPFTSQVVQWPRVALGANVKFQQREREARAKRAKLGYFNRARRGKVRKTSQPSLA
jgi:hypothetical protein